MPHVRYGPLIGSVWKCANANNGFSGLMLYAIWLLSKTIQFSLGYHQCCVGLMRILETAFPNS